MNRHESPGASAGRIIDITDANFEADVLRSKQPVLLEVWAPWCRPCKGLEPELGRLAENHAGRLVFAKANLEDCRSLPTRLGLSCIPTLILFRGGREMARTTNVPTRRALARFAKLAL
jgi:thioredoxin 1